MRVLVLDDNLDDLTQVRRAFAGAESVQVTYLTDPEHALIMAQQGEVDVLVSDINMPQMSGIELASRLRQTDVGALLPIIFLTGASLDTQSESLLRGGDAVMSKPVVPSLLVAQIEAFRRSVGERNHRAAAQSALEEQAHVDVLTGLWNRRGIAHEIEQALHSSKANEQPFSVLLVDVDDFKKYTNHHGTTEGDAALQTVAAAIRFSLERSSDIAGRFGWEQFVICLPGSNVAQARQAAEAIRETLRELSVLTPTNPEGLLTVSMGIATGQSKNLDFGRLFDQADRAMFAAKDAGGNQIGFSRTMGRPVVYSSDASA